MKTKRSNYLFKRANKSLLLLSISMFMCFTSTSQEASKHQLLWKIEHKDSDKVSYLFGTMHLQDKRVFNFGDSLIPAIQRTEAFALEVHPDSAEAYFSKRNIYEPKTNMFREALSEEEYESFNARFEKLNEVSIDEFYSKNPLIVLSMFADDEPNIDDKRVFLDSYLYGIAKTKNKLINGLEDPSHYDKAGSKVTLDEVRTKALSVLDYSEEQVTFEVEKMIKLYADGDLVAIDAYIRDFDFYDELNTERNHIMFTSMKNIMRQNTLFTAVGAGHLTGDDGLIKLFKEDGYAITAVDNTFNNPDALDQFKLSTDHWEAYTYKEIGLSIALPGTPKTLENKTNTTSYFVTDPLSGIYFSFSATPFPTKTRDPKEVFDLFIENLGAQSGVDILSSERHESNGVKYLDVLMKEGDSYSKNRVASLNNNLFSFSATTVYEELNSHYTNTFFDSIIINILPEKPVQEVAWTTYTNANGAFSCLVPDLSIIDLSQEIENPYDTEGENYIMNIDFVTDTNNGKNYLMRYNDLPSGYYLEEFDALTTQFREDLSARGEVVGEPVISEHQGLKVTSFELILAKKFHSIINLFTRGNRVYVFIEQNLESGKKVQRDSKFFSSIKFLDYEEQVLDQPLQIEDFSVLLAKGYVKSNPKDYGDPADFGEFDNMYGYYSTFDATGGSYSVQVSTFSEYFRTTNIEDYLVATFDNLLEYNDSLHYLKDRIYDGVKGKSALITSSKNKVKQYIDIIPFEDKLVIFYSFIGDEEVSKNLQNAVVGTVKFNTKPDLSSWTDSKAKKLFADLKSEDKTISDNATKALAFHEFDKKDLSILEKNLTVSFPNDSLEVIKPYIVNNISHLGGKKQLKTLLNYYHSKQTSNSDKLLVIENLLNIKEANSDQALIDLIKTNPPERKEYSYPVFYHLLDSTAMIKKHAIDINNFYNNSTYKDILLRFYISSVANDPVLRPLFEPLEDNIYQDFDEVVTTFKDSTAQNQIQYKFSENMLDNYYHLTTSDSLLSPENKHRFLKGIYDIKRPRYWTTVLALTEAITSQHEVQETTLAFYLEDMFCRLEIMQALNEAKQLEKVPQEYLAPVLFGALSCYNNIDDNGNYPSKPPLHLGQVTYQNDIYNAYKVSFAGTNEDSGNQEYLFVCLNSPVNTEEFYNLETFSDWAQIEDDWTQQAKNILTSQ